MLFPANIVEGNVHPTLAHDPSTQSPLPKSNPHLVVRIIDNRTPQKQHHLFVQESAVPRAKTFPGNHPAHPFALNRTVFSPSLVGVFFPPPSQSWWAIRDFLVGNREFLACWGQVCGNACRMYKLQDICAHLTVHEKDYWYISNRKWR